MKELKCPECGKYIKIDDHGFNSIVKQVRDSEFNRALEKEKALSEKDKEAAVEFAVLQAKHEMAKKEQELVKASMQKEQELVKASMQKEQELTKKNLEIEQIKKENEYKIKEALSEAEKQLLKKELDEKALRDNAKLALRLKDEEIESLKEFKSKLSVKLIGETLEQHCLNEFSKIKATAFPNAEFFKDNENKENTKGDFIFRDYEGEAEIISIMFEMKNEDESSSVKQTNDKFFDKLNSDREKKKCEYAVLVSMLERESELYNTGIVDVSDKKRPKMFVIRPQFFIPLISLLTNAARKNAKDKLELVRARNLNIDITNFEEKLLSFKDGFSKSYAFAAERNEEAIHRIDEAIKDLQRVKEALDKSNKHWRAALNKSDDFTIRKLTHNNPTMKAMFATQKEDEK